jgi:ABC-type uncharacterized transport system substrate-binding protein
VAILRSCLERIPLILKRNTYPPSENSRHLADFQGTLELTRDFGPRKIALVIGPDGLFINGSKQLAALAVRHAMPAISQFREFPAVGGLMSYGTDLKDAYRVVGVYTGRVLNGVKPAELPVQQSRKVEFVINLKTTKALGLEAPPTLLARADEVIE